MTAASSGALTGPQKAAIVVRMLAGGELGITLADLPEEMQANLIRSIGSLGPIDPSTLDLVTEEFARLLDRGTSGSSIDITGALDLLGEAVSPRVARRLREDAGVVGNEDPWALIAGKSAESLLPIVLRESVEVAAVILSKLNVEIAAGLLNQMPGDRARRVTVAISQTANVRPDAIMRIGQAIAYSFDTKRDTSSFEGEPAERIGAILNMSRQKTRDEMLAALKESDASLADGVTRAIFTFANIPTRVAPSDVPKITRQVDAADLVTALSAAQKVQPAAADFILGALPQRMADSIRGDIEDAPAVEQEAGEAAMTKVIAKIRELETKGEIYLIYDNG